MVAGSERPFPFDEELALITIAPVCVAQVTPVSNACQAQASTAEKVPREQVKLPKRSMKGAYDDQKSLKGRKFVPEKY